MYGLGADAKRSEAVIKSKNDLRLTFLSFVLFDLNMLRNIVGFNDIAFNGNGKIVDPVSSMYHELID